MNSQEVFIAATNVISPLGFSSSSVFQNLLNGESGIEPKLFPKIREEAFPISALSNDLLNETFGQLSDEKKVTRFEKAIILSISDALSKTDVNASSDETAFVFSTTKGNIDLMDGTDKSGVEKSRMELAQMAEFVVSFFGNRLVPVVVSNACISGIMALLVGKDLIQSGRYKNVVVAGADMISDFVLAGFHSFQALSDSPCKPYDATRNGLSLGEGAATFILTAEQSGSANVKVVSGAVSNDANHISGPSRTGEGLQIAVNKTLKSSKVDKPDFISAHGTATPYNDEMESQAFDGCGLSDVPVHSLKGFFGHTLGAAGLIESAMAIESMRSSQLIKSLGFEQMGVSKPMNIIEKNEQVELNTCLKTASGFGGCNAAILFEKDG